MDDEVEKGLRHSPLRYRKKIRIALNLMFSVRRAFPIIILRFAKFSLAARSADIEEVVVVSLKCLQIA
jgi:hypothetical protein